MAEYKPEVGQIGSQLQNTFNLFDGSVLNPDAVLVLEYERMLDTDETVSAAFYFLTLVVISFLGEYTHPDERIATFVNECFEGIDGSMTESCEDILSAVWAGYSATEIMWKPQQGKIMLDYLATYHPYTVTFHVNDRGRLRFIKQRNYLNPLGAEIPKEKCIIFSYRRRFNNSYGKSAFKPIRKDWLLKDPVLKMWARALDKFGTPVLWALVPDGMITDPDNNSTEISQLAYATRILGNLQNGTALAFSTKGDSNNHQIPKVESVASGATGVGQAFDRAVSYYNKMIFRGLLIPSLAMDEGARSGSLALGMSHFDAFLLMALALYTKLKEVLLDQLISRLVAYNFGPQKNWGDFQKRPPSAEELKLWSEIFLNMGNAGIMDPSVEEDFKHARSVMGLPDRDINTHTKLKESIDRYMRGEGD